MASNSAFGSGTSDRRHNDAGVTYGLAAVRRVTLRQLGKDNRPGAPLYSKTDMMLASARDDKDGQRAAQGKWTTAKRMTYPIETNGRLRAIAEVEQAFIAVRRKEPERRSLPAEVMIEAEPPCGTSPVWLMVGGIWLSTIAIAGGAVTAMIYLLS
jgi:hypothetical protein